MPKLNLRLFWGLWFLFILLWLTLNPAVFSSHSVFLLRDYMMQLSGMLTLTGMSVAMILALRLPRIEQRLGGLDKVYRLHKWLGIGVLGLAVFHWLWSQMLDWAVELGLLESPQYDAPPAPSADQATTLLRSLRESAEFLGQWAFYPTAALLVIALVKRVPYRLFRYSHRLLPIAYLILLFHAAVMFDTRMWMTSLGLLLGALMLAGGYAAMVSLLGRVGAGRRVAGEIVELNHFPGMHALEGVVRLQQGWPGHKAGQFAFATSNPAEGSHPYSFVTAWDPSDPRVAFIAKERGHHTNGLVDKLKIGQRVIIEGPYGCFTFDDDCQYQIWIGAGIGITPFLARLKERASANVARKRREINLFHTTTEIEIAALNRLAEDARAANVRLHLLVDDHDGGLNGERIRDAVPHWREASIWFCGPSDFGQALRVDFATQGLPVESRFHQELFELR